ncbi:mini-chromosome maintenance complex-binding protein [Vitis vinifera]|uniref:Mini-chromosome maintenance complex-binding protein n=2 Tax=Vitis vinifera TaxID=29760 RepID=F6HC50_VITVI|nr:mini-chromosome maintenance complex-binding protein [Vitis vinifera]|eukprot:XP_002274437.1 PREDICTED: mini-chromosome maintenance complex-binding protein [Vitis vinifera]
MVGLPYDFMANPLGAVRLTFEKAMAAAEASGSDPANFDGKDWGVADLFRQFLFDNGGLSQVPVLNSTNFKRVQPNTLVRFRGMIQDMLGNELYVGVYKEGPNWRTNKFMDVSQFPMGSRPDMRVWERRLLYCVPVPGQNSWVEPSSEAVINCYRNGTSQQREKRQRDDNTATDPMELHVSDDEFQGSSSNKKLREGELPFESSKAQDFVSESACSSVSMVPTFDKDSLPCLVKIYDSPESDLKLNDVFEFVGVFTFDPELVVKDDTDEFSDLCDDVLANLPPSKVPRLHCLIHRKLAVHDFISNSPVMEVKPHLVKQIRESVLGHLTAVLGNDGLAAHFMLLHLLSRVNGRVDTLAVGKLSLNLTCFNKESVSVFGNQLTLAIMNLLPFTHRIPLTVDYLNSASLAPKKDYQLNRLVTGVLQLAEGSHLTIDETQLKAGTLNSVGVENARLLKNLMQLQKVEYDFKYYKMEMAADVQLLILSEGKSNILPADLVLPFQPSSVDSTEPVATEALEAWRWYLVTLRLLPNSIDPELQKVIEDDLVAARQADRTLSSQDFSRLLTMGRLMSLSYGETSLSLEHWQMVKELERLRRERLK